MSIILKAQLFQILFLITLTLLYNPIKGENIINLGFQNCKIIHINNRIIYISSSDPLKKVYEYKNSSIYYISEYDLSQGTPDILKINNEKFIIFSFASNNIFYQIYTLSSKSITPTGELSMNIGIYPDKYRFKCISLSSCIASLRTTTEDIHTLYIIKFNFETHQPVKKQITIPIGSYKSHLIDCDSFDGINYMCAVSLISISGELWRNYYYHGSFESSFYNYEEIYLTYTFLPAITKINDSYKNKYLICLASTGNPAEITCIYFQKNNNIFDETERQKLATPGPIGDQEKQMIIQHYNDTLFIGVETSQWGYAQLTLYICSVDFVLKIRAGRNAQNLHSRDLLYSEQSNHYYIAYDVEENTMLIQYEIYPCINLENLMLSSNSKSQIVDFFNGHNGQSIGFSLNKATLLYEESTKIESVQYRQLVKNKQYKFTTNDSPGIYGNYYIYIPYGKNPESVLLSNFSFICHINIINCYERCKECNINYPGGKEVNYCTKCIDQNYPIFSEANNETGYNCYHKSDEIVQKYFVNKEKNYFYPCNNTCLSCNNAFSCAKCAEGYYFKSLSTEGAIDYNDICYQSLTSYYFDHISLTFRPCWDTCSSCQGKGDKTNNNCLKCKDNLISYQIDKYKCTQNATECLQKNKYWSIDDNNNIKCIDTCLYNIITVGENKGQCVENCQEYINPYSLYQKSSLITYSCGGQKYCIYYKSCVGLHYDRDIENCYKSGECQQINIFTNHNESYPFKEETEPTEEEKSEHFSPDEKEDDIKRRIKVIKVFHDMSLSYSKMRRTLNDSIIGNYFNVFQKELANLKDEIDKDKGIYLISLTKYENYTITIYPIDIEDYVYEQIFFTNALGFVNFTKIYNYINYEVKYNKILLAIVIENQIKNSSFYDINYLLYAFDEKKLSYGFLISSTSSDILKEKDSMVDVSYPLYNYINSNLTLNKRNTEKLIDNIKEMYYQYPDIEIYNLKDPFYNDICYKFTSDVGTDMAIRDRRNEYYVNQSLCENNCILKSIIDRNNNNPRSICTCPIKEEIKDFIHNDIKVDKIPQKKVANSKSVGCAKEAFKPNSIANNLIFWILLAVLIIILVIIFFTFKNQSKEIKKFLCTNPNPNSNSPQEVSDAQEVQDPDPISGQNPKLNVNPKKKKKRGKRLIKHIHLNQGNQSESQELNSNHNLNTNKYINNRKIAFNQSYSNKNLLDSKSKSFSKQAEIVSAPIKINNPPHRRPVSTANLNMHSMKTGINKSEGKDSTMSFALKIDDKKRSSKIITDNNSGIEDIDREFLQVNNFVQFGENMVFNNYLKEPLEIERLQKVERIKNSLRPLAKMDYKNKYCNSFEDIYYPNKYLRNQNNKIVSKLIEGEDIENYMSQELFSDTDNKPGFINKKNMDLNKNSLLFEEERNIFGNEKFLIPKHKKKYNLIDDTSKYRRKKNKKSGEESIYENLKTEIDDINSKNKKKIKRALIKGVNNGNILGYKKDNKSQISSSIGSDFNALLKDNKSMKNFRTKKKLSKEIDSKNLMIQFSEENKEGFFDPNDNANINSNANNKNKKNSSEGEESISSEIAITDNKIVNVKTNMFLFYCEYFKRKELCLVCFYDKNYLFPFFLRWSFFLITLLFMFTFNCFLFIESSVHNRYEFGLKHKNVNNIIFVFKKDLGRCFLSAFIGNICKILLIKLVLYYVFKLSEKKRDLMMNTSEKGLSQKEMEKLAQKKQKIMENYKLRLYIYYGCVIIVLILFGYFCICYGGIFPNSISLIICGFIFAFIISVIFCAIFCLIIVVINYFGKKYNNKLLNSIHYILTILY